MTVTFEVIYHFVQACKNHWCGLAVWICPFLNIDSEWEVKVSASHRVEKIEPLHIARSVKTEEMISTDFKSCLTSLAHIVDKTAILKSSALCRLYKNKADTVGCHFAKVYFSVVGTYVNTSHSVFFRIWVMGGIGRTASA